MGKRKCNVKKVHKAISIFQILVGTRQTGRTSFEI